jgi:SAM-dependent methyltransferase
MPIDTMNRYHQRYCRSAGWARRVRDGLLPWALQDVDLGPDVLEIGPGFGATTKVLAPGIENLTVIELDPRLAAGLAERVAPASVTVVEGDGTAMSFADALFSGAVCFTMLHHVPTPQLQDRLFAEAFRVLRPGGVFAGCDSRPSLRFRAVHLFDTMTVVPPETFAARLEGVGFTDVRITPTPRRVRFFARKPA